MARMSYYEKPVESKSERNIRIILAVMFFIQIILTTFPFVQGDSGDGYYSYLTAFNMLVQPEGYATGQDYILAIFGGVFVLLPMVAFFFCILDKKSYVKYIVTALCSIISVVIIAFGVGGSIGIGALFTLIVNLITMFLTTMGFMATRIRKRADVA